MESKISNWKIRNQRNLRSAAAGSAAATGLDWQPAAAPKPAGCSAVQHWAGGACILDKSTWIKAGLGAPPRHSPAAAAAGPCARAGGWAHYPTCLVATNPPCHPPHIVVSHFKKWNTHKGTLTTKIWQGGIMTCGSESVSGPAPLPPPLLPPPPSPPPPPRCRRLQSANHAWNASRRSFSKLLCQCRRSTAPVLFTQPCTAVDALRSCSTAAADGPWARHASADSRERGLSCATPPAASAGRLPRACEGAEGRAVPVH